jgi:hypothetical protein
MYLKKLFCDAYEFKENQSTQTRNTTLVKEEWGPILLEHLEGVFLTSSIKSNLINNCVHNFLTIFEKRIIYNYINIYFGQNPFCKTRR